MTLIIIFAVMCIMCIVGALHIARTSYDEIKAFFAFLLAGIFGLALIIATVSYAPSKKDSEILYKQLVQEKASIEQMISSGGNVDKLLLNQRVIDYNNRVILHREKSKRFIFGDYYSKDVDWGSLELVEWK